ncbi:MAG: Oxalate:formate antiporter [Alphaproteobacteria bacterium ADurb.Bin438]|nr:MAG: Oxalate:formate antiporter [Alphaproteobacteria bacterium ADurb.Bin438]
MMFEKGLNVMEIFFNIGIYLGGVAFLCALLMSEPKEDENTVHKPKECLKKYLFTKTFILFCVGIFAGTFAGLMLVGNLKPVMLSVGLNDMYATLSISIFALGNIIGRTIWGEIHDLLGSRKTILISLLFLGLSLPLLLINTLPEILLFIVLLVGIGFGGCFVIYASSVVNNYGIDLFPRLYPFCFLCYGIAGLKGPAIGGYIHELIGSYSYGILLSSVIVLLVFLLFFFKFEEVENA